MVRCTGLMMAVGTLVPALLGAQDLAQLCQSFKIPPVGTWASYKNTGGSQDGGTVRFAIVGSERQGDSTFYWLELKEEGGRNQSGPLIYQGLLGGRLSAPSWHAVVIKQGQKQAMRAPDAMIALFSSQISQGVGNAISRGCRESTSLGTETVQVPAGSFRAIHVREKDGGEGWVTKDLPFAIVKGVQGGTTMALTAHGTGAKSSITETPRPMTMQDMMGQPGH